jgi:two-component sensor histidine kinase
MNPPKPGPRILYIEDDQALGRLVQKTLARSDIHVEVAPNGAAGLERLAAGGFDAVALDHHLPDRDGLDVLAEINRAPIAMPVIYVTANEDARTAVAALKAGAVDYVVKTIGPEFLELLRAALTGAIDRADLLREKLEAEAALRLALDHAHELAEQRALLVHEVNHRVANSLQLIISMLHLQETAASEPAVSSALADVGQRIAAVAGVHRRLYTTADIRTVEMIEYLGGLLQELNSSLTSGDRIRIEVGGSALSIETDKAIKLGLIVNELVTNACKYAYPNEATGAIRVRIEADDGNSADLIVEDDGIGIENGPRSGSGLGQRIVGSMARALGGKVTQETVALGTRTRIAFPV